MMEQKSKDMSRHAEQTHEAIGLMLKRLDEHEKSGVKSTDQSGGFVVEPEPEFEGESV